MTLPQTISADYTLRPNELAEVLALLVEARQPTMVWGPPGAAKSMIARQVAAAANRQYVDVRALLLDPVDLRGIPWRDSADRTRWAPPVFLDHFLAPFVLEIDVDIGRLLALLADETFEQKIVLGGVHGSDAQHITNGGIGGRAAPLAQDRRRGLMPGEADEVIQDVLPRTVVTRRLRWHCGGIGANLGPSLTGLAGCRKSKAEESQLLSRASSARSLWCGTVIHHELDERGH